MNQPDPLLAYLADGETLAWTDRPRRAVPSLVRIVVITTGLLLAALCVPSVYALASGNMSIFAGGWFTLNDVPVTPQSDPARLYDVFWIAAILLVAMLFLAVSIAVAIASEHYGLTARRIIRLRTFPWRQFKSLKADSLIVARHNMSAPVGSVSLFAVRPRRLAALLHAFRVPSLVLHDIADPAHVERLLAHTAKD